VGGAPSGALLSAALTCLIIALLVTGSTPFESFSDQQAGK